MNMGINVGKNISCDITPITMIIHIYMCICICICVNTCDIYIYIHTIYIYNITYIRMYVYIYFFCQSRFSSRLTAVGPTLLFE